MTKNNGNFLLFTNSRTFFIVIVYDTYKNTFEERGK